MTAEANAPGGSRYFVRRMARLEADLAIEAAAREGWNPSPHDAECFWAIDPEGFFAGELDGRFVAYGTALCYDDRFAFCGLYVVDPAHRGQGLALTRARLEHVGDRNAGLDGVADMAGRYERLGYRRAHLTTPTPSRRPAAPPSRSGSSPPRRSISAPSSTTTPATSRPGGIDSSSRGCHSPARGRWRSPTPAASKATA
jgi:GNAT superfamily N-acetyltransferase